MNELLSDSELLARQCALQREAEEVVRDIMLMEIAEPLGDLVLFGSAALGLMVRRDLDVSGLSQARRQCRRSVLLAPGTAFQHPRGAVSNDTGVWNADQAYPDGFYIRLSYRSAGGDDWIGDIWFVDEPPTSRTCGTSRCCRAG